MADPRPGGQVPILIANLPPTAGHLQSLIARLIENQHSNDRAIEEYERIEHVIVRKDGQSSEVVSERIERLLPTGTGIIHLRTSQSSLRVTREANRRQLK